MAPSVGKVVRRVRADGLRAVAVKVLDVLHRRYGTAGDALMFDDADLASSSALRLTPGRDIPQGQAAAIAWVCFAPIVGSGGHTTLFRMVAAAAERGHRNVLVLIGTRLSELAAARESLRLGWPWLDVEVRHVDDGFGDVDVVVASSWETAHVVASRTAALAVHRWYFIQDFEPFFYPRGAQYSLAEDTYRFGFGNIALGEMVHRSLAAIGVASTAVPFGRDEGVYSLSGRAPRSGVCVYVRANNDRRGYLLAKKAIQQFHELHPEQQVHIYGDEVLDWGVPVTNHGYLSPQQLNGLYNRIIGGLALSFTNVSLVAGELLSAGAIPVLNDHADARADLPHPEAVWAAPNPAALAAALARVVEAPDQQARSERAARPVNPPWALVASQVIDAIEARLAVGVDA